MLERDYQPKVLGRIKNMFPGCVIQKLDSGYQQGIPDWLILWGPRWATLEIKRKAPTKPSDFEPNQEYFIDMMNDMSFSACLYPENEKEVLDALQLAFRDSRRSSRGIQR